MINDLMNNEQFNSIKLNIFIFTTEKKKEVYKECEET